MADKYIIMILVIIGVVVLYINFINSINKAEEDKMKLEDIPRR